MEPLFTREQLEDAGVRMHALMTELYPICRSITGPGVLRTLEILGRRLPLEIREVATGTQVLDWTVPREWTVRDAYVVDPSGRKIADFMKSNLHVVSYSVAVRKTMSLDELRPHLHTLPDQPDRIPYRTSYYHDDWGFCLTHRDCESLPPGQYEVVIDSTLADGVLRFGEIVLPGETPDEVLLSTYLCHPSLCNDNLSGVVLLAELAERLVSVKQRRYGYRILFAPETIGAIAWLSLNEDRVACIRAGLVATCVGDPGDMTYKRSRRGDTLIDRAAEKALADAGGPFEIRDFWPDGSDERQFCSPGFDLPVGSLMRTVYGDFPEYHTSADDLTFVRPEALAASLGRYADILHILEHDRIFVNTSPRGEPQLGRRGLYGTIGGQNTEEQSRLAMKWVLNLSDGTNSLLDIACRSAVSFGRIAAAAETLLEHGLLRLAADDGCR